MRTVAEILANPRYTGRQVWNRQYTDHQETEPGTGAPAEDRYAAGIHETSGYCPPGSCTRRWLARRTLSRLKR